MELTLLVQEFLDLLGEPRDLLSGSCDPGRDEVETELGGQHVEQFAAVGPRGPVGGFDNRQALRGRACTISPAVIRLISSSLWVTWCTRWIGRPQGVTNGRYACSQYCGMSGAVACRKSASISTDNVVEFASS
nr:hypothetical protein [Nocardia amikacinitolerans]